MKNQTNLDAIDTSWTWFANPHARWVGDIVELPNPELKPERVYQPLRDHTALFIEFSETPTTKTGILRFAQTYGVLDLGPEGGDRQKHIWVHAISEMKQAVTLWRAIERPSPSPDLSSLRWVNGVNIFSVLAIASSLQCGL